MPVAEIVKQYSLDEALETIHKNGKVKTKYENFIGGKWAPPIKGKYFVDHSPINGEAIAEIAKSTPEDVEKALDAAHAARYAWGHTSPAARAAILMKVADVMEENLEVLAIAETIDNGKPIRETRAADVPLSIDHFRYFAACIRAEEGALGELDNDTVAYHFKEPLGVVDHDRGRALQQALTHEGVCPFGYVLLVDSESDPDASVALGIAGREHRGEPCFHVIYAEPEELSVLLPCHEGVRGPFPVDRDRVHMAVKHDRLPIMAALPYDVEAPLRDWDSVRREIPALSVAPRGIQPKRAHWGIWNLWRPSSSGAQGRKASVITAGYWLWKG